MDALAVNRPEYHIDGFERFYFFSNVTILVLTNRMKNTHRREKKSERVYLQWSIHAKKKFILRMTVEKKNPFFNNYMFKSSSYNYSSKSLYFLLSDVLQRSGGYYCKIHSVLFFIYLNCFVFFFFGIFKESMSYALYRRRKKSKMYTNQFLHHRF